MYDSKRYFQRFHREGQVLYIFTLDLRNSLAQHCAAILAIAEFVFYDISRANFYSVMIFTGCFYAGRSYP